MNNILTREKLSCFMSQIKDKDTKPEILLRSFIHWSGLRFRLNDNKFSSKPDIVLPRYKTAFFVNGRFWYRREGYKHAYIPKSRIESWESRFSRTAKIYVAEKSVAYETKAACFYRIGV